MNTFFTAKRFYIPQSEITPLVGSYGQPFYGIWQMFPWMDYFITDYEKSYRCYYNIELTKNNYWIPLPFLMWYFFCNFYLIPKVILKNRKGYGLKYPLAIWNLSLSLFSIMGVIRIFPYLIYYSSTMSFRDITCTNPKYTQLDGDIGLWAYLFCISKFFELADTNFIALRKRKIIFLHWYHHATVLLFTFYAGYYEHAGIYFIAMNYFVHSGMYFYYAMMSFNNVPYWFKPQILTALQILQMVVGVGTGIASIYYKFYDNEPCDGVSVSLLHMGLIMYSSYFYLFVKFGYEKYFSSRRKTKSIDKSFSQDDTKQALKYKTQ